MTITRRDLLGGSVVAAQGAAKRPNVLWISCEDTGPQLACYGDPHAITPTLDRLAREGVRYTRAYSVTGVCAPSRSSIITGMFPTTLGSFHMRCQALLPDFVKCFPEYLRQAGYYCTNNSKTDYNFIVPKGAWDESSAKAHWRNRRPGQPFFAVFNIETTHESRVAMRGAGYQKQTARLKPTEHRDPASISTFPPYYPDTPEARRDWANYYELITAMDYRAGELIRELEDAGVLEDAIVFFWGDHGVGLPRAKRWLYESGTHVPLIVRAPGLVKPGSVNPELVSLMDLGPTVLNLCGIAPPSHMQSRAFLGPNLKPKREYIYCASDRMDERYNMMRAVRDARYRYVRHYEPYKPYYQYMNTPEQGPTMRELRRLHREGRLPPAAANYMAAQRPAEELYDVEADPHELRNLAGSARHRTILERMRRVHQEWVLETRDLGLVPEAEIAARESELGNRYAILRQPGAEQLMERLQRAHAAALAGDAGALPRALDDPAAAVRYWGATGFGVHPKLTAAHATLLKRHLPDKSAAVRVAAARALALTSDREEAVAVLIREVENGLEWVRLAAAQALDDIGETARPAITVLRKAREKDENRYVSRVANHALNALLGESN